MYTMVSFYMVQWKIVFPRFMYAVFRFVLQYTMYVLIKKILFPTFLLRVFVWVMFTT